MTESSSRRRFLETLGVTTVVGLSGCTQALEGSNSEQTTTVSSTPTATSTATATPTPEPSYPRVIDLENAPSIEESYNPFDLLPENGDRRLEQINPAVDTSQDRTSQLRSIFSQTAGTSNDWLYNARLGVASAWEILPWANHNNMMIDIVTTASGGVGPSIEITYEKEDGDYQIDLQVIGPADPEDQYVENAPESTWHNGNRGNIHFVDWRLWEDVDISRYSKDGLSNVEGTVSNFIPGVNDHTFDEYEGSTEKLVINDDYWRELSRAFETEQDKYLEIKQELARGAEETKKKTDWESTSTKKEKK